MHTTRPLYTKQITLVLAPGYHAPTLPVYTLRSYAP
jgi:hypothetical protein